MFVSKKKECCFICASKHRSVRVSKHRSSVLASTGSYTQFSIGLSVPVSSTSRSAPVSAGSPERSGMHTYEASTSPVVGGTLGSKFCRTAGGALELVHTIAFNNSRGKYICGLFCMLFLAISTEVQKHSIFGIQVQKIKIKKITEGNFVITVRKWSPQK